MSLHRVAIPSPNYSARGAGVRLIVLHTAEGSTSYQSLGSYFANPASQVSSHAGIDDTPGTIGVYVKRADKAWTQGNANPVAVAAELCAFAAWTPDDWHRHGVMLENCAAWIAEESAAFGVPIVRLNAAEAQGGGAGVCQHVDLGSWGGSHHDCGPGFPMDEVLNMARGGAPSPGRPPTSSGASAPPWPGRYFEWPPGIDGSDVSQWQSQMHGRGWSLAVDGSYGPESADVCATFQAEKGLTADGIVGPDTWAAAWTAPVT